MTSGRCSSTNTVALNLFAGSRHTEGASGLAGRALCITKSQPVPLRIPCMPSRLPRFSAWYAVRSNIDCTLSPEGVRQRHSSISTRRASQRMAAAIASLILYANLGPVCNFYLLGLQSRLSCDNALSIQPFGQVVWVRIHVIAEEVHARGLGRPSRQAP